MCVDRWMRRRARDRKGTCVRGLRGVRVPARGGTGMLGPSAEPERWAVRWRTCTDARRVPAVSPAVTWGEPETADQTSAGASRPPLIRLNTRVADAHADSRSVRSPGRVTRSGEESSWTARFRTAWTSPKPGRQEPVDPSFGRLGPGRGVAADPLARCAVEDFRATPNISRAPACGTRQCSAAVRTVSTRARAAATRPVAALLSEKGRRPAGR